MQTTLSKLDNLRNETHQPVQTTFSLKKHATETKKIANLLTKNPLKYNNNNNSNSTKIVNPTKTKKLKLQKGRQTK